MEWMTDPQAWLALATLTALEIVLGLDNIIFISILAGKLQAHQQRKARTIGLLAAMMMRLLLLFSLSWLMSLTSPLFEVWSQEISGRDLVLIAGGLFLLYKSTNEIHEKLEGAGSPAGDRVAASLSGVIAQIVLLDLVFSLDSVITAIGMADHLAVMAIAIILAVAVMIGAAETISRFIDRHPTLKMLALSFLLLIGVMLIGEGLELHIPKGYIYFAMAFSLFVELLNTKIKRRAASSLK
ncbi:MAG: TerC family protein [Nitrospirae bacterium]|nr:MAG: TerC family protein [Nitrospirota bacterium]